MLERKILFALLARLAWVRASSRRARFSISQRTSLFERERNSTISGIQGTGLGMAITKNIVEMRSAR